MGECPECGCVHTRLGGRVDIAQRGEGTFSIVSQCQFCNFTLVRVHDVTDCGFVAQWTN
jgi:hypothetical protein